MKLGLKFVTLLLVICPLSLRAAPSGGYSDPTGVYALIDKVVFEPNTDSPERIQVWGAFAIASKEYGNDYNDPERGYLYFSCKTGKERICRKEWADLKANAGSGQVIGFGSRRAPFPHVRKADDRPTEPDQYPINFGLVKMSDRNTDYPPVRALKSLPRRNN